MNAAEAATDQLISGRVTNAAAGDTVTLGGNSYSATVQADLSWSVTVPSADLAALGNGALTVSASVTNAQGNSGSGSRAVTIDANLPGLRVDTVAGDDVVNSIEHGQALIISGSSSGLSAGATLAVVINGVSYEASVAADGRWSTGVPAADVSAWPAGTVAIAVSGSSSAGNPVSITHNVTVDLAPVAITVNTLAGDDVINAAGHEYQVDAALPLIIIDTIAGDNTINSSEAAAGVVVSGSSTAEAGQTVTVSLNGTSYTTQVQADGSWSLTIPASYLQTLADNNYTVQASVNDTAGNPGSATKPLTLDASAPVIQFNAVTGDDVINSIEHTQSQIISGTAIGAQAGDSLVMTLAGQQFSTTVAANGSWVVTVSAADLASLPEGAQTVSATVSDLAGNSAQTTHTLTVDKTAPTITFATVAGDDIINTGEQQAGQTVSGTTTAEPGQTITVSFAGHNYTAVVSSSGGWSVVVPARDFLGLGDGDYAITATITDSAGNPATASHTVTLSGDRPTITIATFASDDIVSAAEHATPLIISGTTNAPAGQTVTITLNGKTYSTTVQSDGSWNYTVGSADVSALADGGAYVITAAVNNATGNTGSDSHTVTVDLTPPGMTISIDSLLNDSGLSSTDFNTNATQLVINGSVGAPLSGNEKAQISIDGGVSWTDLVVNGTSWIYSDSRTLPDGNAIYLVRVIDNAGNVGATDNQVVVVDTTAPDASKTITITAITTDSGASSSDFITNDTSLTLNGQLGAALSATEVAQISVDSGQSWVNVILSADGLGWTYTDGRALTDGSYEYRVRVIDVAGNVGSFSTQTVVVDTTAPAQGVTVTSLNDDTGRSVSDFITSDTTLTINGEVSSPLSVGETLQISTNNGATWIPLTLSANQWSFTDTRTLTDGSYDYQLRVIDAAGNASQPVTQTVVVDTQASVTTAEIVSYTDDTGERQGTFDSTYVTDDTAPLISGVLDAPLASDEVLYLYRNGIRLEAVTMVGALNWTYAESGLISGSYTYTARVEDLAGNLNTSTDFVLTVDTSVPTTLAPINNQTTRDVTPIINGTLSAALVNGEYIELTVNGVTYTSLPGGAVVVDPANNTWYLQLPASAALAASATPYTVTTQVKNTAGNGAVSGISTGEVTVNQEIDYTPTWSTGADNQAFSTTVALDNNGRWMVVTNQEVMQSTDPLNWTNTPLTLVVASQRYSASSLADWDRNGTLDLLVARNDYSGSNVVGYTNNGNGTWSGAYEVGTSVLVWYSSLIAFDREGDGYLDFLVTDAGGPDSNTFLWNTGGILTAASTTANNSASATPGQTVAGYFSLVEASGVDLNNDGHVDLAQHTYNLNNYYTLSTLINQGDGSFVWGQNTINTFYGSTGSSGAANAVSMTWADFNGDGFMDLYLPATRSQSGYGSLLTNDGAGGLSAPVTIGGGTSYEGFYSAATDWNHDGLMDIVRIANNGQSYLYTNQGGGSNWVESAFGSDMQGRSSGLATMDYDWDGAVDVLVTRQTGAVYLIRNTNAVDYGTSLHLRILDQNGINTYYGNTVRLYDASGRLVASQIINPQAGMGMNDSSALVSFYGLLAGETYHAELVRSVGTVSSNINETVNTSWGGLQATDATHAYVLSGEGGSATNDGNFVGTGYNDTFFATAGTDSYTGAGGWTYLSGYGTWSATGGMDVVDFRMATTGVTVDLGNSTAQATGFNTATLINIEGLTGSDFNDTLTGNAQDNTLEGRGGNDTLNIGSGGHDTLLFKLLNSADATGGNGSDVVNGFTLGTWEGTADTDRIDLRELFSGSGYSGNAGASYINGVATLDAGAGNITSYINVIQSGSNSEVLIDRDGAAGAFTPTVAITINGVQTDLATLLANHQLMVV
ncbi:Ig-like domain-containing protein [Vagococcus sp. WN89Y]|uniref:Ig-like domain-containing protein n=1 Tax=Vagococcus sp. WN89Y TaxID=3457258 RepID=UPI003FCE6C8B